MSQTRKFLEQDLLKIRSLVESMAAQRRSQTAKESLVTQLSVSTETLEGATEALMAQASETLCLIISERSETATAVTASFRRVAPLLAAKITVRVLVPPVAQAHYVLASPIPENSEMRISELSGLAAVISDTNATLVSNSPGNPALIRNSSVATNLKALFDAIWATATISDPHMRLWEQTPIEELGEVLDCLQEGLIDDVAARKLSMSVRTYRRYVADLMALLGSSTRFQAGALAVETGLLPRWSTRVAGRHVPAGMVSRVSSRCST